MKDSVINERFIKTSKAKIFQKMAANDSKSYRSYLNKFVDLLCVIDVFTKYA